MIEMRDYLYYCFGNNKYLLKCVVLIIDGDCLVSWSRAIVRSVLMSYIPVMLFFLITGWSGGLKQPDTIGLLFSLLFVFPIYLLISIVGWCLIGIPTYWIASKYYNQSGWCYTVAVSPFLIYCLAAQFYPFNLLIGGVAVIQVALFVYWIRKFQDGPIL